MQIALEYRGKISNYKYYNCFNSIQLQLRLVLLLNLELRWLTSCRNKIPLADIKSHKILLFIHSKKWPNRGMSHIIILLLKKCYRENRCETFSCPKPQQSSALWRGWAEGMGWQLPAARVGTPCHY